MKTRLIPLIVATALLALVFCVSYANGEDDQVSSKRHVDSTITTSENGSASATITIGVSASLTIGEARGASIYFPIIAGRHFRIEPELVALFALSEEGSKRLGIQSNQYTATWGKLGVGVFYVQPLRSPGRAYFGVRVARLATGDLFSDEAGEFPERKGYLIAPSAGLELGSSHFTFSLELQLDYIRVKCYNDLILANGMGPPVPSHDVVTRSGFFGEGRLFLRAYL
ncbi:MAG: hypothetical protein ACP5JH_00005 [Bacteroidota bacterium]